MIHIVAVQPRRAMSPRVQPVVVGLASAGRHCTTPVGEYNAMATQAPQHYACHARHATAPDVVERRRASTRTSRVQEINAVSEAHRARAPWVPGVCFLG